AAVLVQGGHVGGVGGDGLLVLGERVVDLPGAGELVASGLVLRRGRSALLHLRRGGGGRSAGAGRRRRGADTRTGRGQGGGRHDGGAQQRGQRHPGRVRRGLARHHSFLSRA